MAPHRDAGTMLMWASAALVIAWAFVSLGWPLGYDHGVYVWVGDVVAHGGMAYRDAWDMHGPLVGLLFAIPEWIFGQHTWGVRVMDLAMLTTGALSLFVIVRDVASTTSARWSVIFLVLTYASLGFNETAEPDGWVAMMGLASLRPLRGERSSLRGAAFSGLIVGALTLIKPFYGAFSIGTVCPLRSIGTLTLQ